MINKNTLRGELLQITNNRSDSRSLGRRNDFAGQRGLENSDSTG